jgi:hypothetical protein
MPREPDQTTRQRPTAPTRGRRRTAWPVVLIGGGLVVAVIAGGVVLASRRGGSSAAAPVIAHVHGLGINPADGSLQVATHNGTFRLDGDRPVERVGTTAQDTMGFTVVGPNHFLGSGHPDAPGFRQGKPARLGLIESTDAGATWDSRSLSGEVDFHALATSQGTTYGLDSGTNRLLASTNNIDWETRSTVKIFGFAVDPTRVDHLVAGGADGTLDSGDGGRTWQPVRGAPRLVALSWAPGGTLWGVDGTGGAHRSTDGGASWQSAGRVDGEPEALLATDDRLVVAIAEPVRRTAIYQSVDAGRSWQVRYKSTR